MKRLLIIGFLAALTGAAQAQYIPAPNPYGGFGTGSNPSSHQVDGYMRNNGAYVQPYQQTNPNNTQMDNYGTRGNYNPNNGQFGSRRPRY